MKTKQLTLGSFTLTGSEMLMLSKMENKEVFLRGKTLEYFKLLGYTDVNFFKIPEEAVYYIQPAPDSQVIEVVYDVVIRN